METTMSILTAIGKIPLGMTLEELLSSDNYEDNLFSYGMHLALTSFP